ncbi:MAG: bifunctional phosphoribosylaminoimidazolecarboxamide formyltransferase/IMP cyclohydrolase [Actinobacteria bacterium]|nr:bifunctional phosphoribosylaminoimidazolecarboxamide formyltransferase/IMP cyclohydrolase [Actinomycetota bacterium]
MRALISTHDKRGLERLGPWLHDQGVEILATGGTAQMLSGLGLPVVSTDGITGFRELLGGRVKTLHPALHAGILARPGEADLAELAAAGVVPIDLVVVNLYPFRAAWLAHADVATITEEIDIGGVALIRAAAKNWVRTAVLTHPDQYADAMQKSLREWSEDDRRRLAARAFRLVAAYDADIAAFMTGLDNEPFPEQLTLTADRVQDLRYGENPHQRAAFYRTAGSSGMGDLVLHQGKELSYNNLADLDTAWRLVSEFDETAAVAVKHQNPCGVAFGKTPSEAFRKARAADPVSIFGGIVAINRPVDEELARRLTRLFLEVVVAPAFSEAALALLKERPRLRVVELGRAPVDPGFEWRSVVGGFLIQDQARRRNPVSAFRHVAGPEVDLSADRAAELAWTVVRYQKSNAIALVHADATVGLGGGQTNRIDAVHQAIVRAGDKAAHSVAASDAFFFPDTVEALAQAGVRAALSPGGSVRDAEVLERAGELGLSLWFTDERHFRH